MEPKLEKKTLLKRIFQKQLLVTISIAFLLIFILVGSSYAILNAKTETGLTDVVVQSGNLVATISSSDEMIQMEYNTLGVSNEVGLGYDPYTFTISNNGENKIAYYEIRIVDKEYEISTLPHKSLNYSLSVNGSDYTTPQNLGDNKSYIYVGGSLDIGESDIFNLKLWVNEEFGKYADNKILRASIELTLYSDIPTRNYIIYDSQGGSYIPKTNVVSKRISMQKPLKNGYGFIGWSTTPDGEVEYEANAIYNGTNGITLYAKYEEPTITYNLNGGTGEIPSNKASEGITSIVPTKDGYAFKGWSTEENGEVVYQSGDTYSGASITLYAVWGEPPTAEDEIIEKVVAYSVSSPTTFAGGLVAVNTNGSLYNENDSTQVIREYRYSGPTVNNYIYFNCKDNDGTYNYGDVNYNYNETNCEVWRIVGIFKNSDGNWNLKIMRNTVLQSSELSSTFVINGTTYNIQNGTGNTVYWNNKKSGTNNVDWTTSGTQYYLNKEEDANRIKGYYSTISLSSKTLIDENYNYYLGNVTPGTSYTAITSYNDMLGDVICPSGITSTTASNCNIWYGNKATWNGAIGLLYVSDIGYTIHSSYWGNTGLRNYDSVKTTSWMMQSANHNASEWLISPATHYARNNYSALYWHASNYIDTNYISQSYTLRPVTNLKSKTIRLKGDGTSGNPYVVIEG